MEARFFADGDLPPADACGPDLVDVPRPPRWSPRPPLIAAGSCLALALALLILPTGGSSGALPAMASVAAAPGQPVTSAEASGVPRPAAPPSRVLPTEPPARAQPAASATRKKPARAAGRSPALKRAKGMRAPRRVSARSR
jgi:hypothetical protein